MPEEVLFKSESDQSREKIASFLRKVAENLEEGEAITLKAGGESVTLNPPSRPLVIARMKIPQRDLATFSTLNVRMGVAFL